ncbi:hypothetical protein [Providencia rettgeri]|uniref:hypothetical protein n=1 Tax=Providencia rettgeri TaxID=587 RepID=UPI003B637442
MLVIVTQEYDPLLFSVITYDTNTNTALIQIHPIKIIWIFIGHWPHSHLKSKSWTTVLLTSSGRLPIAVPLGSCPTRQMRL